MDATRGPRVSSYRHDVETTIALLRQRLNEYDFRDDGFAIVKELVQNADDAHASRLDLVVMERGLNEVGDDHLLGGPALVAINDGPFSADNARDMTAATGSSKAAEGSVVGRFGIGQQSVFHLCEAFFYVGKSSGVTTSGLLNPYLDERGRDHHFESWCQFSEEDASGIIRELGALAPGSDGLVLWLPLRREQHSRGKWGVLIDGDYGRFDEPQDLHRLASNLTNARLADLLPQTGHLQEIAVHRRPERSGPVTPLLSVRKSAPELGLSRASAAESVPRAGDVEVVAGESKQRHVVHLRQLGRSTGRFEELMASNEWPTVTRIENAHQRREKTGAIPHGAVTIIRSPAAPSGATLRVNRAVFFPLASERLEVDIPSRWSWTITLHGYWFTDHGRRSVEGIDTLDGRPPAEGLRDDVRSEWNRAIDQDLTRPCLLPVVADAIGGVERSEAEALLQALTRPELRHLIPDSHVLGRPAFAENFVLVPEASIAKVLVIPGPESSASYLRDALPKSAFVALQDDPLLRARGRDLWTAELVRHTLDQVDAEALADKETLEHLTRWLRDVAPEERDGLRQLVWRAAGLGLLPPTGNRSARRVWAQLCELIPARDRLPVALDHREALHRAAELVGECPKPLPLPNWWAQPNPGARFSADGLKPLFEAIQTNPELDALGRALVIALGRELELRPGCLADVPLFRLESARNGTTVSVSPRKFAELRAEGRLFCSRGQIAFAPREVLTHLHAALVMSAEGEGDADIFLFTDPKPQNTEWELGVPSVANILETVAPAVVGCHPGVEVRRIALESCLKWLTADVRGRERPPSRRVLRLMLHGDGEYRANDRARLWWPPDALVHHRSALEELLGATDSAWRLLSPELRDTERLDQAWSEWLGVAPLSAEALDSELDDGKPGALPLGTASREARDALLAFLPVGSTSARRLPAHELTMSAGTFVAACTPHCYLESGRNVPTTLDEVKLVAKGTRESAQEHRASLLREWSAQTQLEEALHAAAVAPRRELADAILTALADGADPFRASTFHSTAWIPIDDGGSVAPINLIGSVGLSGLTRGTPLVETDQVECTTHPGWERARCEPSPVLSAERVLAHLLAGEHPIADSPSFNHLVEALAQQETWGRPEWKLMSLLPSNKREEAREKLTATLGEQGLDANRLEELLDAARPYPRLWQLYLEMGVVHPAWQHGFPANLMLPRADDETRWRPAAELAWPDLPVPAEFLPAPRVGNALLQDRPATEPCLRPPPAEPPTVEDIAEAGSLLVEYFEPWLRVPEIPRSAIAAFVVLLGMDEDECIRELVGRALPEGFSTPERLREDLARHAGDEIGMWVASLTERRFAVRFTAPGEAAEYPTLAGTRATFTTSCEAQAFNMLGGFPRWVNRRPDWLELVRPAADHWARPDLLTSALRSAVERLCSEYLRRTPGPRFNLLWNRLAPPVPQALKINQHRIRSELQFLLAQLGCNADPELGRLLRAVDSARSRITTTLSEQGDLPDHPSESEGQFVRRQRDSLEARLHADRTALQKSEQELREAATGRCAEVVLAKIRSRLRDYEYDDDQVLFELAQNADDAIRQRHGHREEGREQVMRALEIETIDDTTLIVRHRGRCINDCNSDRERQMGYDNDLLHMLRMNFSDKAEQEGATGKFGLGFKSVHLIAEEVRVCSGHLAFDIVAGVWPRETRSELPPGSGQTELRLTLRRDQSGAELVQHFVQRAELYPVFSTATTELRVSVDGRPRRCAWAPTLRRSFDGSARLELGRLHVSGADRTLLVMGEWDRDTKHRLTIAFSIGAKGPAPLPNGVPSVWVTAPLEAQREWNLGYCIGGPFTVDVGRSQLASRGHANDEVATKLGRLLARGFRWLSDHLESDEELRGALIGDGELRDFWSGLWRVLADARIASGESSQLQKLLRALHLDGGGLSTLLSLEGRLPTGLTGEWDTLTSADRVRWMLPPHLGQSTARFLNAIAKLSAAGISLPAPGELVSYETGKVLEALGCDIEPLFPGRVQKEVPRAPKLEHAEGILAFTAALEVEGRNADDWLQSLEFPTEAHAARKPASDLLVPVGDVAGLSGDQREIVADDRLRAGFAPADVVLSSSWVTHEHGLRLVLACRRRRAVATINEMEEWAASAASDGARRAVLRYLLEGRYGEKLADRLRTTRRSWLPSRKDLRDRHDLASGYEAAECDRLIELLYPMRSEDILLFHDVGFADLVARLHAQGDEERDELPSDLETVVAFAESWSGPSDTELFGVPDLRLTDEVPHEPSWLALVVRACLCSIGRRTDEQHRTFMAMAWREEWFSSIADDPKAGLAGVLEAYMAPNDDTAPYIDWIWSLLAAHWVAGSIQDIADRLCDEDHHLLADPTRRLDVASVNHVLSPRADPAQSGGGYDYAPLPMILRIGTPFFLATLRRVGFLQSPAWDPFCYRPTRRVRRLLEATTISPIDDTSPLKASRDICTALEKELGQAPTFGGWYAYPLDRFGR